MTTVTIRKSVIDLSDPCAVAVELRKIRLQIAAGGLAETVRFGEDEVRYTKANLIALDQEIARYETACSVSVSGRRRRFAKSMRFV